MCTLQRLTCSSFAFRMLIKSNNDKIDVNINVRNSKDNAYNTKVILSFTPNINFINVEVRLPPLFFLSVTSRRILTLACDLFRVIRQTSSALCSTQKWSAPSDTRSLGAMYRSVGAAVLLRPGCCGHDPISYLQKSFKVKFEANPKYVEEFIQINVTATRCEKQP